LAPCDQRYLPFAEDPLLGPILSCFQDSPGDGCSLSGWAERLHTTERTLSRRWRNVLGLSFQEWRQRCKLLSAMTRLEAGQPLQTVAYDLGFRSPSAFIEMFRQTTDTTPGSVVSRAHP
jgi:AraC-like DNA-binding protein